MRKQTDDSRSLPLKPEATHCNSSASVWLPASPEGSGCRQNSRSFL